MFDVVLDLGKGSLVAKLEDVPQVAIGTLEGLKGVQHQLQAGVVVPALASGLNAVVPRGMLGPLAAVYPEGCPE